MFAIENLKHAHDGTEALNVPEWRRTGRGSRSRRMFIGFLLASAAAHATVLVALSPPTHGSGPSRASVLEVVIMEPKLLLDAMGSAPVSTNSSKPQPALARASAENKRRTKPSAPIMASAEFPPDARRSFSEGTELPEPVAAEVPEHASREAIAAVTAPSLNSAYLINPAPRYPDAARRTGEQGTVTLRVRVAVDGSASRVAVEKSSGSPHLDAAALEAVKAWRFTPARRGAEAVESWMLVPIVFRLEG